MCVCNEVVLEFIDLVLIIVIFIFVLIDFGFDIEELVSAFSSALSPMTLMMQSVANSVCGTGAGSSFMSEQKLKAYMDFLFVIILIIVFFIIIIVHSRSCIFSFALSILIVLVSIFTRASPLVIHLA
jgi:hypothetical protein